MGTIRKLQKQQKQLKIRDVLNKFPTKSWRLKLVPIWDSADSSTNQTEEHFSGKHQLIEKVQEPAAANHLVCVTTVLDKKKRVKLLKLSVKFAGARASQFQIPSDIGSSSILYLSPLHPDALKTSQLVLEENLQSQNCWPLISANQVENKANKRKLSQPHV